MTHTLRHARRALALVLAAAAATLGPSAADAHAASGAVTYHVQASAFGQTGSFTVGAQVAASAPASVAPGADLAVTLTVGSITVPSSAEGHTVKKIRDMSLRIPVPAGATYRSASLSGGAGYGSGTPSVSESSGMVTVTVPGPISGGTTFTVPTLTLNLTAGGPGTISTTLAGSSYGDPGLKFTAVLSVIGLSLDVPSNGYPSPSPVLTTTTVG